MIFNKAVAATMMMMVMMVVVMVMMMMMLAAAGSIDKVPVSAATVRRRVNSGKNCPPPPPAPPGQYYRKKSPKKNSKTNPPTPMPETSPNPAPAPTLMPETSTLAPVPLLLGNNPAAPVVYNPKQHYCYTDKDNAGKYCWYLEDKLPYGNWKGEGGHGYNDCGPECLMPEYDPSRDYCFNDNDNPDKYCWYPPSVGEKPSGNWKRVGPDNCVLALECTEVHDDDSVSF